MKTLHTLTAGLLSATSGLAQRVALPLLLLSTGLLLVQPCAADSDGFISTGSLGTARLEHSATLLPNGKVLVAGGFDSSFTNILVSAELYDPASGTWTATGNMRNVQTAHTATLLPNGKVLVAGGGGFGSNANHSILAELYDPASGTWTATGSLATARRNHTATLLPNGKVLVAGGINNTSSLSIRLHWPRR
jgi:N-acetylneuraminic acid mutarotase